MIFFGEATVRRAAADFIAHYHFDRNHQGLENRLIVPIPETIAGSGTVERHQRPGGPLNYY